MFLQKQHRQHLRKLNVPKIILLSKKCVLRNLKKSIFEN